VAAFQGVSLFPEARRARKAQAQRLFLAQRAKSSEALLMWRQL